jgi:ABC-type bacteriocin/lantibiotic exporter with double-glycine peptidase domain
MALIILFILFTAVLHVVSKSGGMELPETDKISVKYPIEFKAEINSYFEKQGKSQCSGYSSAYILRCLGENTKGQDIYERFDYKLANGYVLPQALINVFHDYGYKAKMYRGDIKQLKTRLSEGRPIIVLIGNGISWQHYVTIVGYNEKKIFLYDSNKDTDHSKGYNRTMDVSEFIKQWENGIPLFEKIYFVVE